MLIGRNIHLPRGRRLRLSAGWGRPAGGVMNDIIRAQTPGRLQLGRFGVTCHLFRTVGLPDIGKITQDDYRAGRT
jgi:hypothetical protein